MGCVKSDTMKFRVWEFDSAGKIHDSGKIYEITLAESKKYDRNTTTVITLAGIIDGFFKKMFGMINNGFSIRSEANSDQDYKELTIKWHQDTWRLIRIF